MSHTAEDLAVQQFSEQADHGIHAAAIELLASQLTVDDKILVVGAGQGSFEKRLMSAGIFPTQITAADINPANRKIPQVPCVACNLNESIPFPDNMFDVCVGTEVIEHLSNPQRLIEEAHRVLRPKGCFLLTTPNVHSLVQKIRFLFTDRFDYFAEADFTGSGHLHPIFNWWLERVIRSKFVIERYTSYSFHLRLIPGLPAIPMPFRSRLFAPSNIYLLRRY